MVIFSGFYVILQRTDNQRAGEILQKWENFTKIAENDSEKPRQNAAAGHFTAHILGILPYAKPQKEE